MYIIDVRDITCELTQLQLSIFSFPSYLETIRGIFMNASVNQATNSYEHYPQTPKSPEDWAKIWLSKLAKFHKVHDSQKWDFSSDDVIAFLCSKLEQDMLAWKRLKIV